MASCASLIDASLDPRTEIEFPSRRCHRGTFNAMPIERIGHKSRSLHRLHKGAQRRRRIGPAVFWRAHGLLDDHEVPRQQPQATHTPGIGLELLLDARGHVGSAVHVGIHHGLRTGRAQDAGVLELAAEVQVVGAALPHDDRAAGNITSALSLMDELSRTR